MERRKRRGFTSELKAEAVKLAKAGDRTIPQLTKDLDLTESALRERVGGPSDAGQGPPDALTKAEREELQRLRKEVERLEIKTILGGAPIIGREARARYLYRPTWKERPAAFGDLVPVKNMVQGMRRTWSW